MVINRNAVIICLILIEEISAEEKLTLSSNSMNNKTLLKIVESCLHSDTNHDILIEQTLGLIFLLNSHSFGERETQILEKLVEVTQKVMALFPNLQKLQFIAIRILVSIVIE
jgi:hypothetical protein